MKLDILVLAAHPDDAELGCGGTIAKHVALGHKVGIVDFTKGELGTRGTPETRAEEAATAANVLGVAVRTNLALQDGFFQNDPDHQLRVIQAIRRYQPEIVLANAILDRHIDHGKGASLGADASFLSGLAKIRTKDTEGREQAAWRPKVVYHYIQSQFIVPDFIMDITGYWETKLQAIKAFKSQFYDPSSQEPETYISNPAFLQMIESRALEFGHAIGARHGEGFTVRRYPGVNNLFNLI
ncbi:bacillithiol biosynthesis deacetylase BshB1 [Parachryseolinea silvisoli]|jgi:N-acetylglucosamine malate deacetylase 1|uniref:bacillithiol biosynthesis deacetylase BshB1 n=1 Tax=Parachryseolinea silvisoli TaxID=2873601 RepID=UPI002265EA7A|nr:bacillithiol biosynthesis deacetylase BshB1 [Parachryseolinea silvisoli]MCD9018271.1 bacillithiol biosynthesis deacetylase BshB1 [Parachryseolinea silvisoli]